MTLAFARLARFVRKWDFIFFSLVILSFLSVAKGGINTTTHMLIALASGLFLWWHSYIGKSDESVTYWAKTLFLVYYIIFFLAYFKTRVPNEGANMLIALGFFTLTFFIATQYFRKPKKMIGLFRILCFIALAGALYGYYVYINAGFNRFSGVFSDIGSFDRFSPNAWADVFLAVGPVALYLAISRTIYNRWDRLLGILTSVLVGASFILTYSRGAWLSMIAMMILGCMLYYWAKYGDFISVRQLLRKFFLASIIGVLITAVVLLANYARGISFPLNSFYDKAFLRAGEKRSSIEERLQFFEGSVKLLQERPWIGYGPFSFRYIYPTEQKELLAHSNHPHNFVYKLAVEIGLIGIMVLFVFMAIVLSLMHYALKYSGQEYWGAKFVITMSLLGVTIHNLVDYNFNYLYISFIMALLLGGLFALVIPHEKKSKGVRKGWHYHLIMAIIFGNVIFGLHEGVYGYGLKQARSELAKAEPDTSQVISYLERADNLWQYRDVPVLLTNAYMQAGHLKKAEKYISDYAIKNPFYSELWYLWGKVLESQDRHPEAMEKYMRAIEMDPLNDLRFYLGLMRGITTVKDAALFAEWKPRVQELLEQYGKKLETNSHFTALTLNPLAAIELHKLCGNTEEAKRIRDLYDLEVSKMELLFQKEFTEPLL